MHAYGGVGKICVQFNAYGFCSSVHHETKFTQEGSIEIANTIIILIQKYYTYDMLFFVTLNDDLYFPVNFFQVVLIRTITRSCTVIHC